MNILLLQLKRIGDLILTTPAIAAIRATFPNATVTLIVSDENAALLPALTGIDRTFVVKRTLSDIKIFRTIWREQFDYCIDFTRNDRSALLTSFSRAKKRIVSDLIKMHSRLRASAYNEFVDLWMNDLHTVDYHLALLQPLGIQEASPALHLQLPASTRERADEIRRSFKIDNPFAIFHPGSARVEKFWEPRRWAEVIEHARSVLRVTPVLTSGDSELELKHVSEIKTNLSQPIDSLSPESSPVRVAHLSRSTPVGSIVDLTGELDLPTLGALIEQARLLVTVDTAPMHLAAAVRTPQVVLFGPTNPFHWRPRDTPASILQGKSPSPLTEFSTDQPRLPMNDISTEAVINAMDALLPATAAYSS